MAQEKKTAQVRVDVSELARVPGPRHGFMFASELKCRETADGKAYIDITTRKSGATMPVFSGDVADVDDFALAWCKERGLVPNAAFPELLTPAQLQILQADVDAGEKEHRGPISFEEFERLRNAHVSALNGVKTYPNSINNKYALVAHRANNAFARKVLGLLGQVASSGVETDLPDYVTVQIDRQTWEELKKVHATEAGR